MTDVAIPEGLTPEVKAYADDVFVCSKCDYTVIMPGIPGQPPRRTGEELSAMADDGKHSFQYVERKTEDKQ